MNEHAAVPKVSPSRSIKAIFLSARELPAGEERDRYLETAVGEDRELRRRVERMLASLKSSAPKRLGQAVDNLDLAAYDLTVGPGIDVSEHPQIGPYKLLEQIGEGGMGIVYVAEQKQPVRRKVALKIIKPGMDTRQVIARFEAERQALALMDHPSIAKVLDAGATDAGRPYFVMDLVSGTPITNYCDQARASTIKRLSLFIEVCKAIQHAHQKGIIHRDIKPSNVLITMMEDGPVPKVIDFGIAKAIDRKLTEQTLHTAHDEMIGTPLYMSPEQAEKVGYDVDTRSDVYSLGVLLYKLLTGQTPFDKETMKQAGFDELRRIIREDEPQRPSTRVSTLAAGQLSTVSDLRGVDPRKYSHALSGELDWIVMKALEKDRNRRYESASAFAADIERYLSDEPVAACPPSSAYRLRKYVRRNKGTITAALLVAVALITGTAVATWQAIEAETARKEAVANFVEMERQKKQVERLKADVEKEHKVVAQSLNDGLETINRILTAFQNSPPKHVAEIKSRIAILNEIRTFASSLQQRHIENSDVPNALVRIYAALGGSYAQSGDHQSSLESYESILKVIRSMPKGLGSELTFRLHAVDSLNFQGWKLSSLGRDDEAERIQKEAVELASKAVSEYPQNLWAKSLLARSETSLASLLLTSGRLAEAKALLRNSTAILTSDMSTYANQRLTLLNLLEQQGEFAEAEKVINQAIASLSLAIRTTADELDLDSRPTDNSVFDLGRCFESRGRLLLRNERVNDALEAFRKAGRCYKTYLEWNPTHSWCRNRLDGVNQGIAELRKRIGQAGTDQPAIARKPKSVQQGM